MKKQLTPHEVERLRYMREMSVVFFTIAGEFHEELGLLREQVAIRHV